MVAPIKMNTNVLAWMGDAVYEQYVRKHVVDTGQIHADKLHISAVKYVKASAQAHVMKTIISELPEEEEKLVKRANNKKFSTKAKNADPVEYKWATAFEALIGYYYLSRNTEKLDEVLKKAVAIIENR